MKTTFTSTQVIAGDSMDKSVMGMSVRGMDIASYFLRDRIYTNKKLAPIREIISNAVDEHVKYKIEKEVDVSVNRVDNAYIWSCRDYAKGLSEHDIRYVFGMYFESTKGNSNEYIGGLGIGSKSFLCYTDTFFVTSHFNNIKTSYVCTLGRGDNGVPVGEIYKVSEEATTEQGIEVSADITKDSWEFIQETITFVKALPPSFNVIFTDNTQVNPLVYTPLKPLGEIQKGIYTFYKYEQEYRNNYIDIRMGGVVYKEEYMNHYSNCGLVVDVPIGKLSIPISREGLESTPQNTEVLNEIRKYIEEIYEEDRQKIVTPKFGEVRSGNVSKGDLFKGEWFDYDFRECFPDTYSAYYKVATYDGSLVAPNANGSYIIYVFPTIKNTKNWHIRLEDALRKINDPYTGYMGTNKAGEEFIKTAAENGNSLDISDCVFVDVKSLKLPKLEKEEKGEVAYCVMRGSYTKKTFTPQQFDDFVTSKYYAGVDTDDGWWNNAKDMDYLNNRTIGLVKEYSTNSDFWRANSQKMVDAMLNLGWILPNSPERISKVKEIQEKAEIERLKRNAVYDSQREFFELNMKSSYALKAVKTKPERVKKIKDLRTKINQEDSVRSRILKSISTYSHHITRQDLRNILKMK